MATVPPLPLGADEGYEWMSRLSGGWHAVPAWGRDGWDLGSWPYVVVAIYDRPVQKLFALAVYVEGDVSIREFTGYAALSAAIDDVAEFYWRSGQHSAPSDLPEGSGLLPHHKGSYWGRKP
jgi:hypothetical protein